MNKHLMEAEDIRKLEEEEIREDSLDLEDMFNEVMNDPSDYDRVTYQTLGLSWNDFV